MTLPRWLSAFFKRGRDPLDNFTPRMQQVLKLARKAADDPDKQCHTFGPYLFGITGLRIDGDFLSVTVGMDKWSAIVTFNLASP